LKVNRLITHYKLLADTEIILSDFTKPAERGFRKNWEQYSFNFHPNLLILRKGYKG